MSAWPGHITATWDKNYGDASGLRPGPQENLDDFWVYLGVADLCGTRCLNVDSVFAAEQAEEPRVEWKGGYDPLDCRRGAPHPIPGSDGSNGRSKERQVKTQGAQGLDMLENQGRMLSKAVVRAASNLGIPNSQMARVLGVSEATMSRLRAGRYDLDTGSKPYELAALFVRLFRELDAMMANDNQASRSWIRTHNLALGAKPIDMISSVVGLTSLVSYVDARRSRV